MEEIRECQKYQEGFFYNTVLNWNNQMGCYEVAREWHDQNYDVEYHMTLEKALKAFKYYSN